MSAVDPCLSFGRRVREFREQLGISQEALADKAELDRTYVSGVERGKRNVGLRNIHKIATALGVSASKLLQLDEEV